MFRFAPKFLVLFVAVLLFCAAPMLAQTQPPSTTSVFAIGGPGQGILQGSDGNFYATSPAAFQTCANDPAKNLCAYIFQITPKGVGSVFHTFQPTATALTPNLDGTKPTSLFVGVDGNLYGSCQSAGPGGSGTIFQIILAGQSAGTLTVLKSFSSSDPGYGPMAMIQGADGNFYWTNGTGIYRLTSDGTASTVYEYAIDPVKGTYPMGNLANSLVQGSDGNLYITQVLAPQTAPGTGKAGAIAQLTLSGQFTILHALAEDGSEGAIDIASIISRGGPLVQMADGTFYGVTKFSGKNQAQNPGVAFQITPGGSFTVLHQFNGTNEGNYTNAALTLGSDGKFYGTTHFGGDIGGANCLSVGCGTLFQLTSESVLTTLHTFEGGTTSSTVVPENPNLDAGFPYAALVQANDGAFYGTALNATVFKTVMKPALAPPVKLTVNQAVVAANSPVTFTWQVLNAFSDTAQLCGLSVQGGSTGAGTWSNPLQGILTNGVYSGTIQVTPTKAGNYTYAISCGGNEAAFATLKVTGGFAIDLLGLPDGKVGTPYSLTVKASGGKTPYNWTISGLPDGLTSAINGNDLIISGTPKQFTTANVAITATDSTTPTNQDPETYSLRIASSLKITQTSFEKATVDAKYLQQIAFTGGIAPFTWTVLSGTMPPGLLIQDFSGSVHGTPTDTGNYVVTFQVKDSEATPATDTKTFTIKIVSTVQIAGVEFTQAIQQYQTLDDLESALTTNGEPPVPILSGKPMVMRVYFTSLKKATDVAVTVQGAASQKLFRSLPPDCSASDARIHHNDCPSMDFYFPPPSGAWSVDLTLEDGQGNQLEQETLSLTSRDTKAINLVGASICLVPRQPSSCQDPSILLNIFDILGELLPTSSVPTPTISRRKILSPTTPWANLDAWENYTSDQVDNIYRPQDAATDATSNQRTIYVGVFNHVATDDQTAIGEIGGHGVMLPDATTNLEVVDSDYTLAHEVGHTLSLLHTGLGNPAVPPTDVAPGCWFRAFTSSRYWPYSDNRVQTSTGNEYGFDVANSSVVFKDPGRFGNDNTIYDLMAYCVPQWISPLNYTRALVFVNGGQPPSSFLRGASQSVALAKPALTYAQGSYWNISGSIASTGTTLDPIFTGNMVGTSDAGSGAYLIQELDASGQALFARHFAPTNNVSERADTSFASDLHFSEYVPATTGTATIAIFDPSGNKLTSVAFAGAAPAVTITSPGTGFIGRGLQTVSWTATSATASKLTSRISYSIDNGTSWEIIEDTTALNEVLDFNVLPGRPAALLRIDVSDGVNTGSATSAPFDVPKKLPSAIVINTPISGTIRQAANPVYLSGAAYDADDGILSGIALQWSDSAQGILGTGSPLTISLQPGSHTITLRATDSDGNALTKTTQIMLGGAPPVLSLTVNQTSACPSATVSAARGNQGANLSAVNYSLDGGNSYSTIPLTNLPFTFDAVGTGTVNVVAVAVDASGQVTAQSQEVSVGTGCAGATLKASAGSGQTAIVGSAFTTALTALVTDASGNPISGVTVNYAAPASGASATLSASSAITNSSGIATATATANTVAGPYNITATASNGTSTATFALTNWDFSLAPASNTLSISRGSSGTDILTLTAVSGFTGTVTFACSGLPSGATCTFSPTTLTPTSATASTTLTVAASQMAMVHWPAGRLDGEASVAIACAVLLVLFRRRNYVVRMSIVLGILATFTLAGCGGASSSSQPPPGLTTATIIVTGSSGAAKRTTTITLQVQ